MAFLRDLNHFVSLGFLLGLCQFTVNETTVVVQSMAHKVYIITFHTVFLIVVTAFCYVDLNNSPYLVLFGAIRRLVFICDRMIIYVILASLYILGYLHRAKEIKFVNELNLLDDEIINKCNCECHKNSVQYIFILIVFVMYCFSNFVLYHKYYPVYNDDKTFQVTNIITLILTFLILSLLVAYINLLAILLLQRFHILCKVAKQRKARSMDAFTSLLKLWELKQDFNECFGTRLLIIQFICFCMATDTTFQLSLLLARPGTFAEKQIEIIMIYNPTVSMLIANVFLAKTLDNLGEQVSDKLYFLDNIK